MVNPVGDMLPLAIGVMISPLSIVAVISMLLTRRGRGNSLTFLLGWILGLIIIGSIVFSIAGMRDYSPGSEPSIAASIIKLLAGVLLLFLATMMWRISIRGEQPKLLAQINAMKTFTPVKAFGLGLLLSAAYPKNLTLTLIAALTIVQAQVSTLLNIEVFVIFIIICSILIIIPVFASFVLGDASLQILNRWKAWNEKHYTAVMVIILIGLATMNLGKGLTGLLG